MVNLSDREILFGLKTGKKETFNYLYEKFLPMIFDLLERNSGSNYEAKDLFQDAVIIIFEKVKDDNFKLTSSFKTYFYSVCWNLWLQRLAKQKKNKIVSYDESVNTDIGDEEIILYEEEKLYQHHFQNLKDECKTILKLFFKRTPYKEIAEKLNFTESYIKKLKFKCKEKLYESILTDPRYYELTDQFDKFKVEKKHKKKHKKK